MWFLVGQLRNNPGFSLLPKRSKAHPPKAHFVYDTQVTRPSVTYSSAACSRSYTTALTAGSLSNSLKEGSKAATSSPSSGVLLYPSTDGNNRAINSLWGTPHFHGTNKPGRHVASFQVRRCLCLPRGKSLQRLMMTTCHALDLDCAPAMNFAQIDLLVEAALSLNCYVGS